MSTFIVSDQNSFEAAQKYAFNFMCQEGAEEHPLDWHVPTQFVSKEFDPFDQTYQTLIPYEVFDYRCAGCECVRDHLFLTSITCTHKSREMRVYFDVCELVCEDCLCACSDMHTQSNYFNERTWIGMVDTLINKFDAE